MYDYKANRQYYIDRGRCPCCSGRNRLDEGHKVCPECREKNRAHRNALYAKRKAAGLCIRCGEPVEDGRVECRACRARHKPYQVKANAKLKRKRDRLREEGKCTVCGISWAEPGHVLCKKCMLKERRNYALNRDYYVEYARARRVERMAKGICVDCGKPSEEGMSRCKACRERNLDSSRKYEILKRIRQETGGRRG